MAKPRAELIDEISAAFSGVTLEHGDSITDAMICDEYPDTEVEKVRKVDNATDWTSLPGDLLASYRMFNFLGAQGYRYYLPAFMIAALNDLGSDSARTTIENLTEPICHKPEKQNLSKYTALNACQRQAVAHFLEYVCDEAWDCYSPKPITRAIREYWSQSS